MILRWELPDGWRAACSWGVGRTVGRTLPIDELRQAVYMAGDLERERLEPTAGLDVVAVGPTGFDVDVEAVGELVGEIIGGQATFTREQELDQLVVTIVPTGSVEDGRQRMQGAGFARSMTLWLPNGVELTSNFQHLIAHELFHTWNGRLIRPAAPLTEVAWFTEGFTDYYAARLLHADGVWSSETYATWINERLRAYATNPAVDAPTRAAARSREALAYQQGLLLGLRWHALARERGALRGIDAWFDALLTAARRNPRFRADNRTLREMGERELGSWFGAEFDRYVRGTGRITLPEEALGPGFEAVQGAAHGYALGFDDEATRASKTIQGLVPGSAAEQAGLREGDAVLAWYLSRNPNIPVKVKVRRDETETWIEYLPRGAPLDVQQFRVRGAD